MASCYCVRIVSLWWNLSVAGGLWYKESGGWACNWCRFLTSECISLSVPRYFALLFGPFSQGFISWLRLFIWKFWLKLPSVCYLGSLNFCRWRPLLLHTILCNIRKKHEGSHWRRWRYALSGTYLSWYCIKFYWPVFGTKVRTFPSC